jgi:hypothetical protein
METAWKCVRRGPGGSSEPPEPPISFSRVGTRAPSAAKVVAAAVEGAGPVRLHPGVAPVLGAESTLLLQPLHKTLHTTLRINKNREALRQRKDHRRSCARQGITPALQRGASAGRWNSQGRTQNSQVDPAVRLKIPVSALALTQILGQPCGFQVPGG